MLMIYILSAAKVRRYFQKRAKSWLRVCDDVVTKILRNTNVISVSYVSNIFCLPLQPKTRCYS